MPGGQPFGIFFVEFGQAKLPVVVLRRILNALVIKKRNSANPADRQRWDAADLLFISAFGEDDDREIAFAHFHKDPETSELPVLRVLGWDGADTTLKTQHVTVTLKNRLHWPEDAGDHDAWRTQWRGAFRHRLGHVIKTSSDLADALASFASKIRDAAVTIMAHESEAKGQLRKLHRAFQSALISDLSEEDFADTYAQTVTYGLLTAAISRTEMSEGRHGTALTQEDITAMVPVTNPFLKEMLQEFLKVGGRKGGVDFDELGINEVVELLRGDETDFPAILRDFGNRKPGEDPVIHFYEHFLASYNKQLRIQRGVFYTPQPVVGYIVRSVHELLQSEFGLEDGLASTVTWGEMLEKQPDLTLPPLTDEPGCKETISPDEHFVQILDPATGTATFLVEVIDVIYGHLSKKWAKEGLSASQQKNAWNDYVPNHLLPRLNGYELMMAPYAIAHMKIGLKLAETGYSFRTEERARIYLTNALEPWVKQLPLIGFDALAHEAEAVNEIKRHKRFTLVIGNPPYSAESHNPSVDKKGRLTHIGRLMRRYFEVNGRPLNERNPRWLQDDYVKFFRLAESEIERTGVGVLGFITNHGYLANPTFRGLRYSLLHTFSSIRLSDLHGNSKRGERCPDGSSDENVFDIQQGVAVFLASKLLSGGDGCNVTHADLFGIRADKYQALDKRCQFPGEPVKPVGRFYSFTPQNEDLRAEFDTAVSLPAVFASSSVGMVTGRDALTLHYTRNDAARVAGEFLALPPDEARQHFKLGADSRDWKVFLAQDDLRTQSTHPQDCVPIIYRPFDIRFSFYSGKSRGFHCMPRGENMGHMLGTRNLGLITARSNKSRQSDHFFCTRFISEAKCGESTTQSCLFPLYRSSQEGQLAFGEEYSHAFHPEFLRSISLSLGLKQIAPSGLPIDLTPEDIFHYAYAVFHSPGYRSRYAEFLKIDFPRLPLTGNLELFRALARLGGELTALHLLESPKLDDPITEFIGDDRQVSKATYTPHNGGTVWLDGGGTRAAPTAGTSGFHPVPEAVWNFHIGGYQVCEKWLKDRQARGGKNPRPGRTLTEADIAHYHKIVIALTETIRLMAEIDDVIESHGGWPDAFQTDSETDS